MGDAVSVGMGSLGTEAGGEAPGPLGTEVKTTGPGATREVQVGLTPPGIVGGEAGGTTWVVGPAGGGVLTTVVGALELSGHGTAVVIVVVMVVGV